MSEAPRKRLTTLFGSAGLGGGENPPLKDCQRLLLSVGALGRWYLPRNNSTEAELGSGAGDPGVQVESLPHEVALAPVTSDFGTHLVCLWPNTGRVAPPSTKFKPFWARKPRVH